jgi:predicted porin
MSLRFIVPAATLALAAVAPFGATAQSSVTVYGRVDLSMAQQVDAVDNKEIRNGSGSRFGVRGVEDLGGGMNAFFQLEHRFNADDGTASTVRFWEGQSIVGLEGKFGRFWMGRDENPAYTLSQIVADPWGGDTVASNLSIVNGRIGTTRYSNTANYRYSLSGATFAAQVAEADGNVPAGGNADDRPYSLGLAWASGPLTLGLGYENPADRNNDWLTANAAYKFGDLTVGAMFGTGKNSSAQKHRAMLVSATYVVAGGELRSSIGELKNKDVASNGLLDRQFALGYHYPLSRRTTVYADLVRESRDGMTDDRNKVGYDVGLKHSF